MTILQTPILVPVSAWTLRNQIGLLHIVPLPGWARFAVAILLLN